MVKIVITQYRARSTKVVSELPFPSEERAFRAARTLRDQLPAEFKVDVVGASPRQAIGHVVPKINSVPATKTVDINPWLAYSKNIS